MSQILRLLKARITEYKRTTKKRAMSKWSMAGVRITEYDELEEKSSTLQEKKSL
jgi:hypothetical protein